MPFNKGAGVVYGADSADVTSWACTTFATWLESLLNDNHATQLGLTTERKAIVTHNARVASAGYSRPLRPPVVFLHVGSAEETARKTKFGSAYYNGARHEFRLDLDMGVSDKTAGDSTAAIGEDAALAAAVMKAVRQRRAALDEMGLYNSDLTADAERQRAGEGRHPLRLTFFSISIDTYPSEWEEE